MEEFNINFTKINTPPWVFFTFFELYKWYQIAQRTTNTNEIQNLLSNSKLTDIILLLTEYQRPLN